MDHLMQRGNSATARRIVWFAALGACFAWSVSAAAGQDAVDWKTGVEFRRQLESPVGLKWGENPLRDAIGRLARTQGTAIFLDRRVDPDQRVEFTSRDEPFEVAIARLCQQLGLGESILGSVIYIGPKETADKLATVAALRRKEASQMSPGVKAKWLKQEPLAWPELTTPAALVEQLARDGGFVVNGELPHDLWPAYDLPPLPLADRLSLLLAGFGLTYEIGANGGAVNLTPLPENVEYEQSYTRSDPARLAADLKRVLPGLKIGQRGNEVVVRAPYEDHEKIERMLRGEKVKTVAPVAGEKRYTLKVANQPAGAVARTVAKEIGKELKYDASLLPKLKQSVTFSVQDVPLDELLRATLEPLGLRAELTEDALNISAID